MYPNEFRKTPRQDISAPINPRPIQRPAQTNHNPGILPNTTQHSAPADYPEEPPKKSKLKIISLWLLVLILIGGAGYGGYYYANYEDSKKSSATSNSTGDTSTENVGGQTPEANSNVDTTHYVLQTGLPYDLSGKKKFILNLGLPAELQAIGVDSDNSNRGYEKFYTDKYNDELGRWDIGYPELEQKYKSQVSIVAISKSWLSLSQQNNTAFNNTDEKLNTPQQKKAYVDKIRTDSNECAKDSAKGFTTQDSFFNVCFSIIPGIDSYSPILVLQGYGEAENTAMLFIGSVSLEDGKVYDKTASKKLLADAKEGKLPQSTIDLIAKFSGAFSKTTLKVEDN